MTDYRNCPRCGFELVPPPPGGKRKITTELLEQTARVYRESIGNAPTAAVAMAFGVSHRMASNYVAKAREHGLLPATTQGRRSA